MESRKLKDNNFGKVAIRSKFGASFDSIKKSTGDIFTQMHPPYKKDKENREGAFLKKKKLVYAYLKA